jgi:hypothetical protein
MRRMRYRINESSNLWLKRDERKEWRTEGIREKAERWDSNSLCDRHLSGHTI